MDRGGGRGVSADEGTDHSPIPRLPKTFMTSIMAPWPFYQWGMDILGPLTPARGGAKFVVVPIKSWCKRLGREKAGWVDELPNVLWVHRTSIKQSNGETPFSLTYGSEAVIPAEIGMPSYRTLMIREEFNEEESSTTTKKYARRDLGQESLCTEGMRLAE
ncbi:reverse transcriptase domain-containing protein, partial [Tanacetum coccineum]